MKLKTRLIVSFGIIIVVPMLLALLVMYGSAVFVKTPLSEADLLISAFLILLFTAIILYTWLYRGIIPKIRKLEEAIREIEEGNLAFTMDTSGRDELSELTRSYERMRTRLLEDASDKLRAESDEKMLISNIAHDLRTPLTAIQGYSEGLLDGVADTPEKRARYLKTIQTKASEMSSLLNELTMLSRIDTDLVLYNFAHLSVKEYFSDCVEEIGMDLVSQGAELMYTNYVEEGVEMIADPEQLRRVIGNIVGNSIKYQRAKPLHIHVAVKDMGAFIQVEIADNGQGISSRDLPHIFERMYRGDYSRNSSTPGSGIGLSISRKIISDHGGRIWADSKEGVGSTFYFLLHKYHPGGSGQMDG